MKTKKSFLLVLLVIAVVVVIWYCIRNPSDRPTVQSASVETNQTNEANQAPVAAAPNARKAIAPSVAASQSTPESNAAAWIETRRKQIEEEVQKGVNEWRTPIEFYGMVVDENTNPVSGVQIDFSCNDTSPTGNSHYQTTSDANGVFALNNAQGKLLVVRLSKQGYYTSKRDNDSFEYGDRYSHFVPDANSPVVYHIRKKGVAEPLIVLNKNFQVSISGKPLEIDLRTGKVASPGLETAIMEFVKQSPEKPDDRTYDWSFRVTVPGGGLLLSTNEFAFLAPERGYELSDSVEMKSSLGDDWQSRMKREYFVKLPDGNYAHVILDLMSHNGSLKVQAFINPSGSRNLEFDPQIAINP